MVNDILTIILLLFKNYIHIIIILISLCMISYFLPRQTRIAFRSIIKLLPKFLQKYLYSLVFSKKEVTSILYIISCLIVSLGIVVIWTKIFASRYVLSKELELFFAKTINIFSNITTYLLSILVSLILISLIISNQKKIIKKEVRFIDIFVGLAVISAITYIIFFPNIITYLLSILVSLILISLIIIKKKK